MKTVGGGKKEWPDGYVVSFPADITRAKDISRLNEYNAANEPFYYLVNAVAPAIVETPYCRDSTAFIRWAVSVKPRT